MDFNSEEKCKELYAKLLQAESKLERIKNSLIHNYVYFGHYIMLEKSYKEIFGEEENDVL